MSRRQPKDTSKYLDRVLAGARLLNLVMERILFVREHVRVRWALTIWYWSSDDSKDKGLVFCQRASFSSGDPISEQVQAAPASTGAGQAANSQEETE